MPGLADPEWHEMVMVIEDKLTLEKAVPLHEGLEMGKSSRATLKPGAVD